MQVFYDEESLLVITIPDEMTKSKVLVWDDHSEVLINQKYNTGSGPLTGPCAAYWPLAFGNTRVLVKIRFQIRFKS